MSHIFRAFLPQFIYFYFCAVWRFVCSFVLWLEIHTHMLLTDALSFTPAVHQYCRRAFDSIYNRMFMQSNIKCLCVSFFFSMFSFAVVVVCRVTTYFFSLFFLFWVSCFVSRRKCVSAIVEYSKLYSNYKPRPQQLAHSNYSCAFVFVKLLFFHVFLSCHL